MNGHHAVPDLHIYGTVLLKLKSYFDLCQLNDNATKIRGFGSDTSATHYHTAYSHYHCSHVDNGQMRCTRRRSSAKQEALPQPPHMFKTSSRPPAHHDVEDERERAGNPSDGRPFLDTFTLLPSFINFPYLELPFPPSSCWMRWKGT